MNSRRLFLAGDALGHALFALRIQDSNLHDRLVKSLSASLPRRMAKSAIFQFCRSYAFVSRRLVSADVDVFGVTEVSSLLQLAS